MAQNNKIHIPLIESVDGNEGVSSLEVVALINSKLSITSLDVANILGKRHDNVIRDIKQLIAKCPNTFHTHNFVESSYTNEQGKEQPVFILHRDGFMLLVMGYTGKEAMKIKLACIEAFNADTKRDADSSLSGGSVGQH